MPELQLTVNGAARAVDADPAMPLLWVLRDLLGLTGTKYGCGVGECGACTIHLDGQPARSCLTAVSAVGTRAITTIEGLAGDELHAVQAAWIEHDVPQCGYCQAGQLMAAAALVERQATSAEVETAMRGHLCRCGSYQRIREALGSLALSSTQAPGGGQS